MSSEEGITEVIEERIYTVPLRRHFLKKTRVKRAKAAVNALRRFVKRHMKVEEDELIRIDPKVNEAIWARGAKKPPARIKVLVQKVRREDETHVVYVKLPEEES